MSREQQQNASQQLRDEANVSSSTQQLPFEPIDDMQEKYLKEMPQFKQLHAESNAIDKTLLENDFNLDWIGDTLQVVEFMHTFGDKLRESLKLDGVNSEINTSEMATHLAENGTAESNDHTMVLSNIESFRLGLQNKNEKYRKEVINLVQLLLKSVIKNNYKTADNASADEDSNEDEESNDNSFENTDSIENESKIETNHIVDKDDFAMIKRLNELDCNELTFSELLRLYFLRCLNNLRIRRVKQENQNLHFGIDVTAGFCDKLKLFTSLLETKSFDLIEANIKASMMAYLCDELLTTTNYELDEEFESVNGVNNLTSNGPNNANAIVNGCPISSVDGSNQDGIIVKDLEQTIDELNTVKHEKWVLESKTRSLKTEKLTATLKIKKSKKNENLTTVSNPTPSISPHPSESSNDIINPATPLANSTDNINTFDSEKDKNQKNLMQIEKKLTQIDKKRIALKRTFDKCLNRLRSGVHLGQDRYMRHYWSLVNTGGIYVESCQLAGPGSYYFSDDSNLLLENTNRSTSIKEENIEEEIVTKKVVSDLLNDLITKLEHENENVIKEETPAEETNESEEEVLKKYSNLIDRLSDDDPFKFLLNSNHPEVNSLTFRQIEILIKNQIQLKAPQPIDNKYLNSDSHKSIVSTNGKWWLCTNTNMLKSLMDCLCKRGYREKGLTKSLNKLNEENYNNSNETTGLMPISLDSQMGQDGAFYQNRYLNSAGNSKMFEKQANFFKDLVEFQENLQKNSNLTVSSTKNNSSHLEHKEQQKILKQIQNLEDKVFKSNLQQVNKLVNVNRTQNGDHEPLQAAKTRLLDLEKTIERRYLKYPFAPLKKFSNIKLNKDDDDYENNQDEHETKCKNTSAKGNKTISETLIDLIEKNKAKIKQNLEHVPRELQRWRRLVTNAKTASQLSLLINELHKVIAWNKSIMRVICQICNCDTNEDKLLLCDNCDCGSHTYCFKPQLKTIPEGDWYCFICIGKLLSEPNMCCVCGSSENISPILDDSAKKSLVSSSPIINDLFKCDKCSKIFHGTCMPNAKHFKTTQKSHCMNCQNNKSKAMLKNANYLNQDENESSNNTSNSKNKKSSIITDELGTKKTNKKPKNSVETISNENDDIPEKNSKIEAARDLSDDDDTIDDPDDDLIVNTTTTGAEDDDDEDDENDDEVSKSTKEQADTSKNNEEKTSNGLKKKKKRKKGMRLTLVKKSKIAKTTHESPNSNTVNTNSTTSKVSNTSVTSTSNEKDLTHCRTLLNELMRTENAWPFLNKVNQDDYPNYYEVIKEPMDFNTIKSKLHGKPKQYETKEQFAYDCRLIFDNCEFYNEDKSEIGRAGHKLRAFFETKWVKLFD